uniref:Uncharacterized protein n=1 Tax=viral metagenome TaxID=1070528 RepID=A0A6C0DHS1_9ZZZZ
MIGPYLKDRHHEEWCELSHKLLKKIDNKHLSKVSKIDIESTLKRSTFIKT